MCKMMNCPLLFRETLDLRKIVAELTELKRNEKLSRKLDCGRLLYDVCIAIGLDPWSVLPVDAMIRLVDEDCAMVLWPVPVHSEQESLDAAGLASSSDATEAEDIERERRIDELEMRGGPRPFWST